MEPYQNLLEAASNTSRSYVTYYSSCLGTYDNLFCRLLSEACLFANTLYRHTLNSIRTLSIWYFYIIYCLYSSFIILISIVISSYFYSLLTWVIFFLAILILFPSLFSFYPILSPINFLCSILFGRQRTIRWIIFKCIECNIFTKSEYFEAFVEWVHRRFKINGRFNTVTHNRNVYQFNPIFNWMS